MTTSQRPHRGLTLIELCVALTVLAIVASASLPALARLAERQRLEHAARTIATDLHWARSEAVAGNRPVRFSVFASARCYVVHTGARTNCSCDASGHASCTGDARLLKQGDIAQFSGVDLQSSSGSMLFDPLHGTVTPTATLKLSSGATAIHHVVNLTGRVRSCSPGAGVTGYAAC